MQITSPFFAPYRQKKEDFFMSEKKVGKRLLTWVLVLVMTLSLLPLNVLAVEGDTADNTNTDTKCSTENSGAHLVKSATKDGNTYQIQLESWVTGKFEPTTGSAPLDIVLVLDQSGSMAKNGKLESLKKAVSDFVDTINQNAKDNDVEHRIAIVGFASNGDDGWDKDDKWENTGLFIDGEFKKYIPYTSKGYYEVYDLNQDNTYYVMQPGLFGDSAVKVSYNSEEASWGYRKYEGFHKVWVAVTPMESENDTDDSHTQFYEWHKSGSQGLTDQDYQDALVSSGEDSIKTAISKLSASGTTRASYGMEMANKVFENNPNTPSEGRSRVVVFFTDGEPGYSGYETDEAGRAIAQAHATKNTYGAKVFSVGMFDDPSDEVKDFMNYVSSNYPNANASEPSHIWEDWTINSGDPDADKYYMTVKGGDLSTVFEKISGSILTPNVKADANTVLTDKLSQYFDFDGVSVDEDGTVDGVTVNKVAYLGNNTWAANGKDITSEVAVDLSGRTVTVSGFDYSDEENVVTDGTNGTNPSGYKLVVTFNVKPDISYENWDVSGRYPTNSGNATLAKVGEEPFATVASPDAAVETYQVTYEFDKTAPNGVNPPVDSRYYISGQQADVKKPESPIVSDGHTYTFNGWKIGNDEVNGETIPISGNVTLIGTWTNTANTATYTVNYLWNGEPIPGATSAQKTAEYGTEVTEFPIEIEGYTPVKESETITIDADNSKNVINLNYYKNVTLTANSDTVTYDGQPHDGSPYSCEALGLLPGHMVTVEYTCEPQTNVGEHDIELNNAKIVDADGKDVTALYQITYNYGKLTITRRNVTLTSADASKPYDGMALTNKNVTVGGNGFADGEGATYNVTGSQTEVGESANAFTYTLNNNTKESNYNITKHEGKLKITAADSVAYKVEHYKQNLDGSYNNTPNDIDPLSGTAGTLTAAAARDYPGFTPGTVTQEKIKSDGTTTIKIQYTRSPYTLTINYVYRDGSKAAESHIETILYGKDYSVTSPKISGYTADKLVVSGTMPADNRTVTVTYTKNGGHHPRPKPTVEIEDDDALGLNTTDHFAYIVGYGNGEVRPQNNITRAEVATIFFRLLTDDVRDENLTKTNRYSDVAATSWYNTAVSTLSSMGIITGYPDGTFRPNAAITRAEFAAIAARFDSNGDKTTAKFSDIATHWAKDEISIAYNNGWITGYPNGTFGPQRDITRAETMTLVNRVLNRQPETEDDLLPNMTVWTDNANPKAWYYLAVQEATNSHYYEFKTNSQYEKWTELREPRDWSQLEK